MWLNIRDDNLTPAYYTHTKSIRVQCIAFKIYIYGCYFRNAMYFKYKSNETRHSEGKYNIYTLNYIQLCSFVSLWSYLVLQSFYFQCNWWKLFQKPVVWLYLIFTFLLCMLYLNLFKLSTHIHVDSDYFLSRFSYKYCLFFDLSLVMRGECNFSLTLLLGSCSQQFLFYYDKVSRCVCYEYQ